MLFADTYEQALLKASLSVVQVFIKFLNSQQLEDLLVNVINASHQDSSNGTVDAILETISQESKRH